MSGWIKTHRKIANHWLWEKSEFNYYMAWQDMLFNAAYKATSLLIKGQLVKLEVGQLAWSDAFMQKRWGWSRNKVRKFISNLEMDGMVVKNGGHKWSQNRGQNGNHNEVQQKVHLTSVISICNYSKYQSNENIEGTAKGTTEGTTEGTAEGTQSKKLRSKEVKNKGFTPPLVEDVRSYCLERNNNINAEEFIDHYEANGWMRGKNKIKDWKACVRTWEKNSFNQPINQPDQGMMI